MIRIKIAQPKDLLSFAAIIVAFFCATNGELLNTSNTVLYYLPFLMCFAALAVELFARGKLTLSSYSIWRILLVVFFLIAYTYALNADDAFMVIKRFILLFGAVLLIGLKCTENPDNIRRFMKFSIFTTFVNLLYLATTVDLELLAAGVRLGAGSVNESWNANHIGLISSIGAVLTCYIFFIDTRSTGRLRKIFGLVLVLFFLVIAVLSGSRKSLLIFFSAMTLYLIGSSKSHKIRNILTAVVCIYIVLYAVYNIPFLYEYIGYRFEGLLETLQGGGGDKSSLIRKNMVEIGLKAFLSKPILGYGLDGFSTVYGRISGTYVYAHNNYVETLVNTGLVGFLLYYGYIAWVLFKRCGATKKAALFKSLLIALLIADIGLVSYMDPFCQYILCLVIYSILQKPFTAPENSVNKK